MTPFLPQNADVTLRLAHHRDLDSIVEQAMADPSDMGLVGAQKSDWSQAQQWYGSLRMLRWFPNPLQHALDIYVAVRDRQPLGAVWVEPANCTRSTWRVKQAHIPAASRNQGIGSELLRHCFETIWEARTWMLEVDVNCKNALATYRQNGFQPLAQHTYWTLSAEQLQELTEQPMGLPNFMPVTNADAPLLYQLDTAAMPPHVRQVFDRHVDDFRTSVLDAAVQGGKRSVRGLQSNRGYVFEPQRKAAIGYCGLTSSRDGEVPHQADLTVHPAYTWLYPELLRQMAHMARSLPEQSLILTSADYQPEREAYFESIGAQRGQHTLLLARSVWHKLRESRMRPLESWRQEVLQGLKPAKPLAGGGRMFWGGPAGLSSPWSDWGDRWDWDQLDTLFGAQDEQPQNYDSSGPQSPDAT
ncbi:MAG: GNAT family N-acetyltransferase [Cyanobacteria bacterium P01_C01_bin.89]